MSFYRTQLEDWLNGLDVKAGCVFDVGGKQSHVKERVKSWSVKDYEVLDLPEFDLHDDWSKSHYSYKEKANVVFCLEVFEYLIDPIQALKNIEFVMKDNKVSSAKAYISVPLIYPVHNEVELDSLRYTENGFKRLCAEARLQVKDVIYRKPANELLTSYYSTDGMKAAKGIDHRITGYIFEVIK